MEKQLLEIRKPSIIFFLELECSNRTNYITEILMKSINLRLEEDKKKLIIVPYFHCVHGAKMILRKFLEKLRIKNLIPQTVRGKLTRIRSNKNIRQLKV